METARPLLILLRSGAAAAALRRLLERFGDPAAALAAGALAWAEVGIPAERQAQIAQPDHQRIAADLDWLAMPGHHLIGWHEPDYPALLRRSAYPPAALFVAGDADLLWHPQIAVVGSRGPSAGGRDLARRFAHAFARAGWAVTSGLAEGIDTAAHDGALAAGRTLAVVATGPDRVYPTRNAGLADRIERSGSVISEHPPGTAARRQHFPSRNRLIAGLSLATVVIEAGEHSGALITARLAAEAGRDVFAVPGSVLNPMVRGCHQLIREGAGLVESAEEVIAALAPLAGTLAEALRGRIQAEAPGDSAAPISANQAPLWEALGHDPVGLDQLCERTGLTVATLSAMLLAMEMAGRISVREGRYSRIS